MFPLLLWPIDLYLLFIYIYLFKTILIRMSTKPWCTLWGYYSVPIKDLGQGLFMCIIVFSCKKKRLLYDFQHFLLWSSTCETFVVMYPWQHHEIRLNFLQLKPSRLRHIVQSTLW